MKTIELTAIPYINKDLIKTYNIEYNKVKFPSGEIKIEIKDQKIITELKMIHFRARLKDEKDLFELMLIKDALGSASPCKFEYILDLIYLPYMRQDRVCSAGECFSLNVVAGMVNSMNFDEVNIYDPHSNVAPLLINNAKTIGKNRIFFDLLSEKVGSTDTIVLSPDVGAYKEVNELALKFNAKNSVATGFKHRDLKTGEISRVTIHGNVTNKNVVIIDDICDGGRTFIELAKLAKTKELYDAKSVELVVTHGIFTKGLDALKPYIDKIYTTDSYYSGESNKYIEVIKL